MRAPLTPLLYGTAGSLLLTALVAAPAGGASGRSTPPEHVAEARGTALAAERAAAKGIAFGACPKSEGLPSVVKCGTVSVPFDYADPDGRQIKLTVSRAKPAKPKKGAKAAPPHQGALVFNPGGPGASGMYFPLVSTLPEWKKLAGSYDLVGYAPRGVGRSAPLSCQDPKEYGKAPSQSPTHPDEAYKAERVAQAKAYARDCGRSAGEGLRQYTTLNNARDLDVLRAGLGEKRLTFMGASYGTYFGAVYATLFPGHVRRMVFDSAVDPDPEQIWYRNNLDQSVAFENRWTDFREWVASHDATYHLGTTVDDVQKNFDKAKDKLARKPAGGTVGPGQLQGAYLQAGYYDDYWASRAHALSRYLKGDPKPLVRLAAPVPEAAKESENGNAVYTAVECNDAPWPTEWRTWDEDNTRLARIAPFETWDNAFMNLPCAYWPAPRQRPVDVGTDPGELAPTLILAAERDAATPYQGALELHRRLAGSTVVTERGAGTHGIAGGPNKCVNAYVDAYLLDGKLPEGDADCQGRQAPKPDTDSKAGRSHAKALPRAS
ncbi:alpha/beta hydrolase [Streptomyces tsukubensis]|uniref:Protease n=1 Tax=Streptomyces tsukubensis TaxID=83656 RepID=A0A1V4AAZ2_9ACTN|nr:alpha/beta hydrolase [Streptomyces tsukubensis]OON80596.1 protease [Streptomyces tsukubensis]QFR96249.1 alpha/beta fold hydrolase [Streptomyces tsukubensis]